MWSYVGFLEVPSALCANTALVPSEASLLHSRAWVMHQQGIMGAEQLQPLAYFISWLLHLALSHWWTCHLFRFYLLQTSNCLNRRRWLGLLGPGWLDSTAIQALNMWTLCLCRPWVCGSISIQDLDMWFLLLSNVVRARKKIEKGMFLSQDKILTFNLREE